MLALLFALALIAAACGDDDGDSGGGSGFFGGGDNGGSTDTGGGNGGGGSTDSDGDVLAAVSSLQGSDAYGMTITFDATGADLIAAMNASGEVVTAQDEAIYDLLATAEVRINASDDASEFAISLGGGAVMEVITIGETVYMRMDLDGLASAVDRVEPGAGAEIAGLRQMAPMFSSMDPQLAFISDFVNGDWVSLEAPESTPFDDEFGINPGAAADVDPDAVLSAFEDVLRGDVEITSIGDERYLVEVDVASALRSIAQDPELSQLMDIDPAEVESMLSEAEADGMATTWTFEVGLNNGELQTIRMDLATLATDAPDGATLPILITFTPGVSPPSAPSEHTPIPPELLTDPSALENMFGM
ncbi:MAG: hypothetical protein ACXIVQ_07950 [Acidimicrobiales bacterium]